MQAGQGRAAGWLWAAGALLPLLAGCATGPPLDQLLAANKKLAADPAELAASYRVQCPDVLEVAVAGRPDCTGRFPVRADGRIALGPAGVRVEGLPAAEVAARVAAALGVPAPYVQVRVADYNSQQLYLFGEVAGLSRAVPYRGPETVVELLLRVGGVTPGAAPSNVQVVRPHVAEGRPPEVFPVDLPAILVKHDPSTNVRLQPFDQVYVGQTFRAVRAKSIPPCLRPLYDALTGLNRPNAEVRMQNAE
jgi:protein involved in polysaccharide export with SLBB domain